MWIYAVLMILAIAAGSTYVVITRKKKLSK